jgi:hypothetical protein
MHVPELLFNVFARDGAELVPEGRDDMLLDDEEKKVHLVPKKTGATCDGKQRLTSIWR